MLQDTLTITEEIQKAESGEVTITYYTLDGKHKNLSMCPGDLYVICNVLYDYANLISEFIEKEPDSEGCTDYIYQYHINRCRRIQDYIEKNMGYSTEEAIARCRKNRTKKSDDIGEDALVQVVKARRKRQEQTDLEAREQKGN